ncbi:MAG TPA: MBL fold metallo-hydrolase [Candidatus Saccharimonadales bacterium]|nr:MBL fold metallo-hydrolase [Candidatus Saccharimonadales bacterium]
MAYLQFLGAAGTVTGSKHLINTSDNSTGRQGLQVLIDCGLFQGRKELRLRNWEDLPVPAREIDAVILTHAHLDHAGWIPRLVKEGFKGPIYATPPTIDLCAVMLPDSGHIQEEEARFHNQRGSSKHKPALPLYTLQEAEDCLRLFQPVQFHELKKIDDGFSFRFVHAGHILGSSMVEIFFDRHGEKRKFLFTGDIGRVPSLPTAPGRVVHAGPDPDEDPDLLVMESTYGNRNHPHQDVRPELAALINDTVHRGGSVVVPAFAVERTQKFLFLVKHLIETNQIPRLPVFSDSPMAIKAVEIFMKYKDEFTDEARDLVSRYGSPLEWEGFHFAPKQEDSKKINEVHYPCIIVSSSGMVTGGRILHHLLLRLADPRNQVIFVGFQAPGTRGEIIKSGAKSVRIYSEDVPIRAHVAALEQFSDHADTEELLRWLQTFKKKPESTFLVHGEPEAATQLQQAITSKLGWNVHVAQMLEKVALG